jgi:hypothetical protein
LLEGKKDLAGIKHQAGSRKAQQQARTLWVDLVTTTLGRTSALHSEIRLDLQLLLAKKKRHLMM